MDDIAEGFFDSLFKARSNQTAAIEESAKRLCYAQRVSEDELQAVLEGSGSAEHVLRRARFGIEILTELDITHAIDPGMLRKGNRLAGEATRFVPLARSFNTLCDNACAVETAQSKDRAIRDFLEASLAFGLEVSLFSIGAPYKMAFGGTRWVANRTLLRFARHGCNRCVALAMSELHYAIRGSVYREISTENIDYVMDRLGQLKDFAAKIDYQVDLDISLDEIREIVESKTESAVNSIEKEQNGGWLDGILDFDLPDISDILP